METTLYAALDQVGVQYFANPERRAHALVLFPPHADALGSVAIQIRHNEAAGEFVFFASVMAVPETKVAAVARYIATVAGPKYKVTFALTEEGMVTADTTVFLVGVSEVAQHVARALSFMVGSIREAGPQVLALLQQDEVAVIVRPARTLEELLAGEFQSDPE